MVDVRISSIAEHLFGKSTQPFKSEIIAYQNASLFFAPRELKSIVPQMEFSLTAVLLSLILLLDVRHEKNTKSRNKYQVEAKVLWKADCPIWKDRTRFDIPYITSTITTTSTKYGLKFVTIRSNDQLTQWWIQFLLNFSKPFMNLNPNMNFFLNPII